jgi:hypothetical protein
MAIHITKEPEPRWPAFVAMLGDALVYLTLPERLVIGPRWLLLSVIFLLLIPIGYTYRRGHINLTRILTFVATGFLTLSLIGSIVLLIEGLPRHEDPPGRLLLSAATLWLTNVLVFALWYWKLDAGGPTGRDQVGGAANSSFIFPQMMRQAESDKTWSPDFFDYLFLAFNTSTAFSPTDTSVLSRWAKGLMMLQALMSLMIIALLAARAVNVL